MTSTPQEKQSWEEELHQKWWTNFSHQGGEKSFEQLKAFIAAQREQAARDATRRILEKIGDLAAEFGDDPKCLAIIGEYVGEQLHYLRFRTKDKTN